VHVVATAPPLVFNFLLEIVKSLKMGVVQILLWKTRLLFTIDYQEGIFPMITVLFVDDEPPLLDVSRLYLEKTGEIKVDTCYSAEQALEVLRGRVYDVIISDYEMPGMDGISFLKTVRKLGIDTPFIIFTGRGREHVVIEALNSGADFYIQKGGDPRSQFAELIHSVKLAAERFRREGALQVTRYSVERAGIPILCFNRRGNVVYANTSACAALGYSSRELCLLHAADLDPFLSPSEWSHFVDRLELHEKMTLHLVMRTKSGQDLPVPVSFSWGEFRGRALVFAYAFPRAAEAAMTPVSGCVPTSTCSPMQFPAFTWRSRPRVKSSS